MSALTALIDAAQAEFFRGMSPIDKGILLASRQDKSSQKVMNSVFSDSKVTKYIGRGLMEILSEPA